MSEGGIPTRCECGQFSLHTWGPDIAGSFAGRNCGACGRMLAGAPIVSAEAYRASRAAPRVVRCARFRPRCEVARFGETARTSYATVRLWVLMGDEAEADGAAWLAAAMAYERTGIAHDPSMLVCVRLVSSECLGGAA